MIRRVRLHLRLRALLEHHAGEVLSRDDIMDALWGVEHDGYPTIVDHHVARARRSLGAARGAIVTVPGVGYRWRVGA